MCCAALRNLTTRRASKLGTGEPASHQDTPTTTVVMSSVFPPRGLDQSLVRGFPVLWCLSMAQGVEARGLVERRAARLVSRSAMAWTTCRRCSLIQGAERGGS